MIVSTKIAKMFKDCGFVNIDYLVESKLETNPSKILSILNRDWRRWIKPLCMLGNTKTMHDGGGLDPTFGYTDIGTSEDSVSADIKMGSTFTEPTGGGTITKITAYLKGRNVPVGTKAGSYGGYSGDAPVTLLASSAEVSVSTTFSWVDFAINYTFAGGNKIWLGVIWGNDILHYKCVAGDANQYVINADTYADGFSNPFGTTVYYAANKMSIYASYITAPKGTIAIHAKLAGVI